MLKEIISNQSSAERHSSWVPTAGKVLMGVGAILLGRAVMVDDDTAFIRATEAAVGVLKIGSGALAYFAYRQVEFVRGQAVAREQMESLEKELDPYRIHGTVTRSSATMAQQY